MPEKVISEKSLDNLTKANKISRQLTCEAIETSLLLLLKEKTFDAISISELVRKAGVSRNAFYRNYSSKLSILESIIKSVIRRLFKQLKTFDLKTQHDQVWLFLFQEAKKEASLLKIITEQHLQPVLISLVAKRLKAYQRLSQHVISKYKSSFWSNAVVSVLSNWISDDMVIPAEEMANLGLPLLT